MYLASYIRKLKDSRGGFVCPATRASAVYFDDDTTLSKLSFYPVGSIFQSTNSTSPASLFGGSWERIQNRFLYGSGTYSVTATGGEEKHTLTSEEVPAHLHQLQDGATGITWGAGIGDVHFIVPGYGRVMAESGGSNGGTEILSNLSLHRFTTPHGGNGSHNNMPPYYCVNIWRRTA